MEDPDSTVARVLDALVPILIAMGHTCATRWRPALAWPWPRQPLQLFIDGHEQGLYGIDGDISRGAFPDVDEEARRCHVAALVRVRKELGEGPWCSAAEKYKYGL